MELTESKKLMASNQMGLFGVALVAQVLRSSIELIQLDDSCFLHSSWDDQQSAVRELSDLLQAIENGDEPNLSRLDRIFAPTGPMQEVSISSGWGDAFVTVAAKYDEAAKQFSDQTSAKEK